MSLLFAVMLSIGLTVLGAVTGALVAASVAGNSAVIGGVLVGGLVGRVLAFVMVNRDILWGMTRALIVGPLPPLRYNWHNLLVRKVSTGFTVLGVALVVFVFTALMAFVSGMKRTLTISGDDRNVIVLKQGATAESNSAVNNEERINLTDAKNYTAMAAEYLTIAALPRRGDLSGNWANVPVRGVEDASIRVHDKVRIIDGESWEQFISGAGEYKVIVGRAASQQFSASTSPNDIYRGLALGQKIKLGFGGNNEFRVAAIFEAGGGVHESEIWAYGPHIKKVYNRAFYSSITVKANRPEDVPAIKAFAESEKVQLTAMGEKEYFDRQTESTKPFLILAYGLAIFMGIAAGFAVANNMFAMVAGRMREIAMLRAIGFPFGSIALSFLIESIMLAGIGGLTGCVAAAVLLPLSSVIFGKQDMIGGGNSFTSVVFDFDVSPELLAISMTMALTLGVAGAWFPAKSAGRLPVVTALRQI